jgi:eukaryotic-like serine/threonine-protein kinase
MLGQTLGNYQIISKMSEGGMGQLYLARHLSMDRRAVVKVLRAHLTEDEGIVRRFINEANAAAMIGHPGIVYVMDVGTLSSGNPYILMEHLEGESLARRLKRVGMLDIGSALTMVRQMADALAAAHDKGIVHRDLKPGNIFLVTDASETDRVKILDFGIAKLLTSNENTVATRTDMLMGTPMYMSPEQCDGARGLDHRSDLYSLGCILFELVCGRPPFTDAGAGTVIAAHLMLPPPAPHTINALIPPELEQMIMRLLAKSPKDRYQHARELTAAIDEMMATMGFERQSMRMIALSPPSERMSRLERPESMTPASSAPVRTQPPAVTEPPMPVYPSLTTQLGSGESVGMHAFSSPRRRVWGILLGMGLALAAAVVMLPWLGGGDPPATEPASTTGTAGAAAQTDPPATGQPPVTAPAVTIHAKPADSGAQAADPDTASPTATNPAAASVAVEIASRPGEATVYQGKKLLGRTPYRGTFPVAGEPLVFLVSKSGYQDQVVEILPDRDRKQTVELERKRARSDARSSTPDRSSSRRPDPRSKLRPEEGGPIDPFKK